MTFCAFVKLFIGQNWVNSYSQVDKKYSNYVLTSLIFPIVNEFIFKIQESIEPVYFRG